jgi:hypothetical protein
VRRLNCRDACSNLSALPLPIQCLGDFLQRLQVATSVTSRTTSVKPWVERHDRRRERVAEAPRNRVTRFLDSAREDPRVVFPDLIASRTHRRQVFDPDWSRASPSAATSRGRRRSFLSRCRRRHECSDCFRGHHRRGLCPLSFAVRVTVNGAIITDVESNGRRHRSAHQTMSHSESRDSRREAIGIQPCNAHRIHERRDPRP